MVRPERGSIGLLIWVGIIGTHTRIPIFEVDGVEAVFERGE
jgi:hypothetical protein